MHAARTVSFLCAIPIFCACGEEHAAQAGSPVAARPPGDAAVAAKSEADAVLDPATERGPVVITREGENAAPALAAGFGLARLATMGVMSSRTMLAEAVYFATAQSGAALQGQVTRNGTITGNQLGWQYAPAPADKLVVNVGGQIHEFEAIDAQGDDTAQFASNWLAAPHRLGYRYRMPGQVEISVQSKFDGRSFEARAIGWSTLLGPRYEVELTARGATQGVSDFDGRESQTRYDVSGRVRGDGVEVDVLEQHFSDFASSNSLRLLTSQRGFATQLRCTIASTVRSGGDTFHFENVQVESGVKEKGGQMTSGVVSASGTIARNGQPFAEVALRDGLPVAVSGPLVIPLQVGDKR